MPTRAPMCLAALVLALTACRDPYAEAAKFDPEDAATVGDGGAQADAADPPGDLASAGAETADAQVDVPEAASDAADAADGPPDVAADAPETAVDGAVEAASDGADGGDGPADIAADAPQTATDAAVETANDGTDVADVPPDVAADAPETATDAPEAAADAPETAAPPSDADAASGDAAEAGADGTNTDASAEAGDTVPDVDLCDNVTCTDGAPCRIGSCIAPTGQCSYVDAPDGISCTDGDPCTLGDACGSGACKPGSDGACDDGNACTADSCSLAGACTSVDLADNVTCGSGSYCAGGACVPMYCGDGKVQGFLGESCDDTNSSGGDGCSVSCAKEATCAGDAADGLCTGSETVASCPADCGFLANRYGGSCSNAGSQDTCAAGYLCAKRATVGGGSVCVADFPVWGVSSDAHPASDFSDGSGVITDTKTGLTWAKSLNAASDWAAATVVCKSLAAGGMDDWRLPNAAELISLMDFTKYSQAWGAPFTFSLGTSMFWSGSPVKQYPGNAWAVDVNSATLQALPTTQSMESLCVRSPALTPVAGSGVRFVAEDAGKTVLD